VAHPSLPLNFIVKSTTWYPLSPTHPMAEETTKSRVALPFASLFSEDFTFQPFNCRLLTAPSELYPFLFFLLRAHSNDTATCSK
jgi:hypothetical protein